VSNGLNFNCEKREFGKMAKQLGLDSQNYPHMVLAMEQDDCAFEGTGK
jgi:hypothetical protein